MRIQLKTFDKPLHGHVQLTSSKSESNRALLINALSGGKLQLNNLSAARDTQTMMRLLSNKDANVWDVLDAGTTMRFCTAYLGTMGSGQTITGTDRMKQRPIGLLVDALRDLGAEIEYLENEGYPPLKINKITEQKTIVLNIPGNISSQFISALLMIGPSLPNGLQINLTTEVFSRPYIEMTLGLMKKFGVDSVWMDDTITIQPQPYQGGAYMVESDWSGASYWYSMAALNPDADITLGGLKSDSLQGDQEIATIMEKLGVSTVYEDNGAHLKSNGRLDEVIEINFKTCPDLAQTVMVTAAAKGATLKMTGLESLRIKETDRIAAMAAELKKIGGSLTEPETGLWVMSPGTLPASTEPIETYDDHRMAMAFAPLNQVMPLTILDPEVVNKSYPAFWDDMKSMGMEME
ncbi:3-phosphoshikimate 1-carboxyvinyltransferase [Marinoscillum sp. MHG1-6]|uniref:3-phosphoshikimate 1-carboxyvinyltransferase n=1 Tax=Marinoscillum sp. MHG1-6 TaxID=2959627 RepID=UPI0021585A0D|nr:3-phosphoshikimate 1-carboxyvinyltransferase [Marinoscillum sp. MHG1-6]